ncbi:MAG: hypothetical protein GTO26_05435, partial [Planctomycetales bacterium]|nr:hypothetical protein [Planctomycetales bacterium]
LSSLLQIATPAQLQAAGVEATRKPTAMIETFAGDWEKEWFTYRPTEWGRSTHKVYHPQWAAFPEASLSLEVWAAEANTLVIGIDNYAAEVPLAGQGNWQTVTLSASDFQDATGVSLPSWAGIKELTLTAQQNLTTTQLGEKKTRQ